MRYNLDVLNDKEFEDLAKDLLDSKLSVDFEIFKAGKDGGIDLRYSKRLPNEIIVQVKHYIGSKYSDLLTQLKKEKNKLDQLNDKPKKYIVFTSLPLSPPQSDEIKEILHPYIKLTGDIYGKRRVESLISKNPEIEKKYFKLWLTSTNIMKEILHNAVSTNSEFQEEKIRNRSKFYIQTHHIEDAFQYLLKNKFLIISGEPGVGKTTLAYMLVYELMAKGYKLIYSDRSIREAEHILTKRADDKQVVFIDDFLGSNLHDIYNPVNPENSITRFIEQIQSSTNKFLIFTSRTTILSQADQHFESFNRIGIKDLSNFELKISAYTNLEKAKILYNHLFHFDLSGEFREAFFINKNYLKIIKHPNYYPRLIETLTQEIEYIKSDFITVEDYVFKNLDNPTKIWERAFEKQLTREDQLFLETLFTFGDRGVDSIVLEQAFECRLKNELNKGNINDVDPFNNCLKKLQDGFLHIRRNMETDTLHISFINPSVADFFIDYLQRNNSEKFAIWESILYLDQFEKTFGEVKSGFLTFRNHDEEKYLNSFIKRLDTYQTSNINESIAFKSLDFLWRVFYNKLNRLQDYIIKLLDDLRANKRIVDTGKMCVILNDILIEEFVLVIPFVIKDWEDFIDLMLKNVSSTEDLQSIVNLHNEYKKEFNEYLKDEERLYEFRATVEREFESVLNDYDFESEIDLGGLEYYGEKYITDRIEDKAFQLYDEYLEEWNLSPYVDVEDDVLYYIDSQQILDDYLINLRYEDGDYLSSNSHSSNFNLTELEEELEIDRIFNH